MVAKDAKPDRYVVDRNGRPDPTASQYYVLDVVYDPDARGAMAYLGSQYRQHGRPELAQEIWDLLDETLPAFQAIMEARRPKKSSSTKKEAARD